MAEFIAFDRIEPWGEWRADLRAGIIASVIANVNRGKKTKAFLAKDFMPFAQVEVERPRALDRPDDSRDWKKWRAEVRGIFGGATKGARK